MPRPLVSTPCQCPTLVALEEPSKLRARKPLPNLTQHSSNGTNDICSAQLTALSTTCRLWSWPNLYTFLISAQSVLVRCGTPGKPEGCVGERKKWVMIWIGGSCTSGFVLWLKQKLLLYTCRKPRNQINRPTSKLQRGIRMCALLCTGTLRSKAGVKVLHLPEMQQILLWEDDCIA